MITMMGDSTNLGKTRLSVQGRSEADGMENAQFRTESKIGNKSSLDISQSNNYLKSFIPTPGKKKEPKFVPYEPYKAAVSPILQNTQKEKNTVPKYIVSEKAKSLACDIIKQNSILTEPVLPKSVSELDFLPSEKICCCKLNQTNDCANRIRHLEDKLSILEQDKKELETQFSIQTQVNADLKKMLLAALGEDMQMKVQYMTEDKAKLGKDVLFYVEQLSEKNEEIERLSVQCDVWKTKFEASSLMVKELALFKSVLSRKMTEVNQVVELLMQEHEEIYKEQQISHSILCHIQGAFNPKTKSSYNYGAQNVIHLAKEIRSLSNNIESRLLGNSSLDLKSIVGSSRQHTAAESLAFEILSSLDAVPILLKLESCKGSILGPGVTACNIMPHECSKNTTINCCNHCSGEILQI